MSWTMLLAFCAGSYVLKLSGVLGLGRFLSGERSSAIGQLLPPALLMALVAIQTFSDGSNIVFDARAIGVGAGAIAAFRDYPFWIVVTIAAVCTALLRNFDVLS